MQHGGLDIVPKVEDPSVKTSNEQEASHISGTTTGPSRPCVANISLPPGTLPPHSPSISGQTADGDVDQCWRDLETEVGFSTYRDFGLMASTAAEYGEFF